MTQQSPTPAGPPPAARDVTERLSRVRGRLARTRRKLERARLELAELRRFTLDVFPEHRPDPGLRRRMDALRAEHLTFLTHDQLVLAGRLRPGGGGQRSRGDPRRGRHGAGRQRHRDGAGQGHGAAPGGVRRVRHDPAAHRGGRAGRAGALPADRRRRGARPGRGRGVLRLPGRPAGRGHGLVRPARRAGRRAPGHAGPGIVPGLPPAPARWRWPTWTATGTTPRRPA